MSTTILLLIIGIVAGALSGLLGIGGGIVMVPALVLLLHYSQKQAQGTTLVLLVLPVGIFAALTYFRAGFVNLRATGLLAIGFLVGAAVSALFAVKLPEQALARIFGGVLLVVAAKLLIAGR